MSALRKRLSANLGFLWKELPVEQRIARAAAAGFAAVEFHDQPRRDNAEMLGVACRRAGVAVVGLNTAMGGMVGLAAITGRESQAQAEFDEALEGAVLLGARAVHVLAGIVPDSPKAWATYVANLQRACDRAAPEGIEVLIEPIAPVAIAGYFLSSLEQADETMARVGRPNLKLLFDCFHIHAMGHDLGKAFAERARIIGHVQIAGIPGRGEPDRGTVDFRDLLARFDDAGYRGWFGCEYRPSGASVEERLSWMDAFP